MRKAEAVTPSITASSVLPSKRRANPDRRADVNTKVKEACSEVDVTFVDNDTNFTSQHGAVDCAPCQREALHLSESGGGGVMSNVSSRTATNA